MKIAFDVSYIQKNRAGIGRHALQLLKSLLSEDPENEYTLHGWSFGIDFQQITDLQTRKTIRSVARIPGNLKRFYWNTLRAPNIETIIGDVDVFHSTDPLTPPTATAKRIATVHDLAYKKFPELFERRVISWDKHVVKSLGSADAIIVPSESTRGDLIEICSIDPSVIHVVRLPIDDLFENEADVNNRVDIREQFNLAKPYMLFVGTLEPRKNIITIVKAFELLHAESDPDIDLVLVGKKGWKYDEILQGIQTSVLKKRIHYLEYVRESDLVSLYRQAVFFVYPSLYEGYGFPILEAMASRLPVITSNNSSMSELSDGIAILVDPLDVNELAEAMHLLVTNEVVRIELQQRGVYATRQISSKNVAKQMLDIYQSITT